MMESDEIVDPVELLRRQLAHKDRLTPVVRPGRRMEWRFRAYRHLLQRLGHGDGMAEVMEVARRDFLDAAIASGDPLSYLAIRAKAQSIVVDELDVVSLPVRAATLYIVGAYQQLDGFLKEFIAEVDDIRDQQSRTRNKDEGSTDWALDVLTGGRQRNERRIWTERYFVLEYYRGIRNAFMHPSKSASSLDTAFRKAVQYRPLLESDLRLQAPNAPDALTLDDFLLFTRTIKYVATDLCRIATPTPDQILEHAERQIQSDRLFHGLTWDTISRERAARKILRFYKRFDFNIESKPGLVDQIINRQFEMIGRHE